ncbi:hypothetical protein [Halorhabdus rudnickae]|uniref:hypothetical protein n=1 Tax=Halorhabdus rudnickae TaxID=1775544 RepID=UPI0010842ABD|nr:hypothetical protein [Halorhabdus rudnickae]
MSNATIKSVFVKTVPSETDDDETLGYELLKTKDDYEHATIIQESEMRNTRGGRYTLVSSGRIFPDDVQATMKPYFDQAGFSHRLSPETTNTVEEQEVRVLIEGPDGKNYHIQKLDTDRYYISHDNKPTRSPPHSVVQKAQTVFPDYDPFS